MQAQKIIEKKGYKVVLGKHLENKSCYFAASDKQRATELQKALDNPKIKAIFFARGGYGSVRIIDLLDFKKFQKSPKWLVGFSDITLFHLHLHTLGIQSIHGPMPNSFKQTPKKALDHLFALLGGGATALQVKKHTSIPKKITQYPILGGNLSIICSALGSKSMPSFKNKVLFIEEVSEYIYAIDRMLIMLDRAGVFKGLKGVLVGTFTEVKDTRPKFGKSVEQLIKERFKPYKIPVVFGLKSGHVKGNYGFLMG